MKYVKYGTIFGMILSVVLILVGCGKQATAPGGIIENDYASDNASAVPSVTAEANTSELEDGVVAVVNGEKLSKDNIGYYIYNNAVIELGRMSSGDMNAAAEIISFDWSRMKSDGITYKQSVIRAAVDDAINDIVFRQMAEKRGYDIRTAENESSKMIDDAIEASGEDKILSNIHMLGISDIESYKDIYTNISVFEGVAKEFKNNPSKYIDSVDILDGFVGSKGATVQCILVQSDVAAEEALSRAKSGESFTQLIKEYNEDSTAETEYTFPEGEVQFDFEKAAFALGIGEISDVVASDKGYYVIKRISGAYELQNYWRSISEITIASNAYDEAVFDEVLGTIKSSAQN